MRKQGKATENVLPTKIISQLLPKLKKQSDTPSLLSLDTAQDTGYLSAFYQSAVEIALTFPRHVCHYHTQVSL